MNAILCRRTKQRFVSYQELRNLARRTVGQLNGIEPRMAQGRYVRKFKPVVDRLKLKAMVYGLTAWYYAGLP